MMPFDLAKLVCLKSYVHKCENPDLAFVHPVYKWVKYFFPGLTDQATTLKSRQIL